MSTNNKLKLKLTLKYKWIHTVRFISIEMKCVTLQLYRKVEQQKSVYIV